MAHAQKPDFVFRRNGRVHLNRQGRQFSRLLAGELCTSACTVCTARASLCSAVMWRLLVTHSILLFPLHFSSRASPCAFTFQTQSTKRRCGSLSASATYTRGRNPGPTKRVAGWAPEPIVTSRRREKSLSSTRIRARTVSSPYPSRCTDNAKLDHKIRSLSATSPLC
jgi:hypothetical protein